MMRRKLLHRMKEVCGATSRMMKDELIVGEHQVDDASNTRHTKIAKYCTR